jgi:AcrR family transcriptional regulator
MSSEIATGKRKYRKRRRAELEDETRLRITEAAVHLHGTVGPAYTSISAIADHAGVQRATVYRHFPTEDDLFAACSAHWIATHPPPDFSKWASIADPGARLRTALGELYAWYRPNSEMVANVRRDAGLVPGMREPAKRTAQMYAAMTETLMRGRSQRGARRHRIEAAIGHALAFETWRSLTLQGLSDDDSVEMMVMFVAAASRK